MISKNLKTWNVILWIVQILLAATLLWAFAMKWFQPAEKLGEMWPWTLQNPGLVKMTGFFDLMGALGLLLPGLLKWRRALTVWAALGIVALMIAAAGFHVSRGEADQIGINVFLALLAALVAWGRRLIAQTKV